MDALDCKEELGEAVAESSLSDDTFSAESTPPSSEPLLTDDDLEGPPPRSPSRAAMCLSVFLLCFINGLNYVNRYTLPPVVGQLKAAFDLTDMELGMIQTCFELVYVASSPLFGYLGDRFDRRYLVTVTLLLANASGLASSFVPEGHFGAFLALRAVVGVGESSYSNIGPVIIADMFVGKTRTLVITLFQFAIPIGCGLGYIGASAIADGLADWRWAFRITPAPFAVSLVALVFCLREPRRGEAEQAAASGNTSFVTDVAWILRCRSFTLTTLGFVGVAFATGALCYWTPYLISVMFRMTGAKETDAEIGLIFGAITILSGMAGVIGGAVASNKFLKPKVGPSADGIVCGLAMLAAAPLIFLALVFIGANMMIVAWPLIFLGIAALCFCWVLISEITINVVVPNRRATATAFMAAISHLLGDALSPYLTGAVSDHMRGRSIFGDELISLDLYADFNSIQRSLFVSPFVIVVAGSMFLMGSLFLNEDTRLARELSSSPKDETNLLTDNP